LPKRKCKKKEVIYIRKTKNRYNTKNKINDERIKAKVL